MNKRLIIRADDVGYTEVYDLGVYQSIEKGIVTSADVMLDSPHTIEVLQWLKKHPWISLGWHRHLWETPVLPAGEVPSLVDEEGRFKWRHKKEELKREATYEDAYKELCAEIERCIEIYGSAPKYSMYFADGTELEKAMEDVCAKYGIDTTFWTEKVIMPPFDPSADRRRMYDLSYYDKFDPAEDLMNIVWQKDTDVMVGVGHPGYLDLHIYQESSFTIHRLKELEMMVDPKVTKWIIENKIELVNADDVINGTSTYQDYLKDINSPLWIGNM